MLHQNFLPVEARGWIERESYSFLRVRSVIDALSDFRMVRTTEDEQSSMALDHVEAILSFPWIPPWAGSA
jgi:hypothetical protein